MPQFSVYRNPSPASCDKIPFLLDVQSDLVSELATRVVVPLSPLDGSGAVPMRTLSPVLEVAGAAHVMLTPQLAGIPRRELGEGVADLSGQRAEIMAALDFLFTGV